MLVPSVEIGLNWDNVLDKEADRAFERQLTLGRVRSVWVCLGGCRNQAPNLPHFLSNADSGKNCV